MEILATALGIILLLALLQVALGIVWTLLLAAFYTVWFALDCIWDALKRF